MSYLPTVEPVLATRPHILGSAVDSLTMAEALAWVDTRVRTRGAPALVVAVNANKYWRMSRDARLRQIVGLAALVIPEYAVVWAGRVLGTPLKAHVGGVMLLQALLPVANERGYRLFFLGAKPDVLQAMSHRLLREYPNLQIAGCHHGYFGSQDKPIVEAIRGSRADVLLVAMGTPRQEYWLDDNLERLQVPVAMGVGGSFDVLAGLKRDAPAWARGNGLEWLYRLCQDPRAYWKRYAVTNPWFAYKVLRTRLLHD